MALVSMAACTAIFQVFKGTERNNGYTTVVRQVQNAGYWISRDAQMADNVTAANLTGDDFLILYWTDWDDPDNPVEHSATYFLTQLTNGIGQMKRSHWSSAGANEETLVADYIYYAPGDPINTSKAFYQTPELTVKLTTIFDETFETREYKITQRPNY
jgi:hypothetical protein